jgi:hypothetical protein
VFGLLFLYDRPSQVIFYLGGFFILSTGKVKLFYFLIFKGGGKMISKISAFIGVLCLFAIPAYAQDGPMYETTENMLSDKYKGKSYSPYAGRDFPNGLYWGDSLG